MIEFLKKHKYKIIAAVCALAVLTGAFLAGESLGNNAPAVAKSSTSDTAIVTERTTVSQGKNDSTSPTENSTKATDKGKSKQSTTAPTSATQVNSEQSAVSNQTSKSSSSSSSASSKSSSQITQSSSTKQDKYKTDPIPEGKPEPVEPQEQEITDNTLKCTFSISCAAVLDNMDKLDKSKREIIPDDGWILEPVTVTFNEGESVFDVLKQVCKDNKIQLEFSFTPIYNSSYIEGINNLDEFDCGSLSGWMYEVNDWFPNYGCSRYEVKNGDVIEWQYTCDLGGDIGGYYSVGE
ncbi:DUF4430 domain-containing protein [Ruminococcus sp.]|uniref:DUF4430 domain-containing protein n=1 Tax=Ruminococcus sp. TaxID=41978 RepID=UPI00262B17B9|nr:DUF4430 domain-containing protein [Ruminococcus sp.]MDD6989122.1 DUF4430 domain-containing protein [Ruminococcus sp.]MDY6200976.1 DUF4430 domain-containing protein [Ruminococcus sp.]